MQKTTENGESTSRDDRVVLERHMTVLIVEL